MPALAGHHAGEENLFRLLDGYGELRAAWGTAHYVVYAFSTENWNRAAEEVAHLMGIFEGMFKKMEGRMPNLLENGVRIRFVGERERVSPRMRDLMREYEERTAGGAEGTIAIGISYGGRADILQAANRLVAEGRREIAAADMEQALWTDGIPAPDLVIRTGGERRLSNFLLWESSYSELAFSDTLWPDFSRAELERHFADYARRERRHGK